MVMVYAIIAGNSLELKLVNPTERLAVLISLLTYQTWAELSLLIAVPASRFVYS